MRARLKRPDGTEEACEAAYLAGCDGAHSTVREVLGIGFPGGTYTHVFYVADVGGERLGDERRTARSPGRHRFPGGVPHGGFGAGPA